MRELYGRASPYLHLTAATCFCIISANKSLHQNCPFGIHTGSFFLLSHFFYLDRSTMIYINSNQFQLGQCKQVDSHNKGFSYFFLGGVKHSVFCMCMLPMATFKDCLYSPLCEVAYVLCEQTFNVLCFHGTILC